MKTGNPITYTPIGTIHSPFTDPPGTPIQSTAAHGTRGTIEIYQPFVGGLRDLSGFSHIILVYHCHLAGKISLQVRPYMDDQPHGVFATRAPARPNPIGISVVRLLKIDKNILYIRDLDMIDGTPLLDIKPYVPEFDQHDVREIGWLRDKIHKLSSAKDDGRFTAQQ